MPDLHDNDVTVT